MRLIVLIVLSLFFAFTASAKQGAPDTSTIKESHSAWSSDPKNKGKIRALKKVLADYTGGPTVDTINAHMGLLGHSVKNDTPFNQRVTALAARDHLSSVADQIPEHYAQAAFIAAIALFNDRQDAAAMTEMAEVEGRVYALKTEAGDRTDTAENLYWRAQAWRGAMKAYFASTDQSRKVDESAVNAVLEKWGASDTQINARSKSGEPDADQLPFCAGEFIQTPTIKYPRTASKRGMLGSLIVRFSFDEAGRVTNPNVLAAIPVEGFEDAVSKAMAQWRWQPKTPENVGKTCRLNRDNVIQQFIFALD